MKKVIFKPLAIIILVFTTGICKAQLLAGCAIGVSNSSPLASLQVGVNPGNHSVYYNQIVHLTRAVDAPQLIGVRYGYSTGLFEPNIGLDYHILSSDLYKKDKPDEGFHLAFGVTKYFKKNNFKVEAGISGKIYFITVGLLKIKK